ncbi:MAG: hypothetical protein QW360_02785 [Thermofilum sp.]
MNVLEIAGTLASGLVVTFGTDAKYLNSAHAAMSGIVAALLAIANLQELVDSTMLVPHIGSGFAYGKISGFLWQKVSEDIETKGGVLNLYEYYRSKKGIGIDPEEHLMIKIR